MSMKLSKQGLALSFACIVLLSGAASAQTAPPAAAAAQPPAAAELPPAQSIIDRHIQAVGGREAVKAHTSVHMKGTISFPANGMSGALEVFASRPNKSVQKLELPGVGEMKEGFDGKVAWSMSPMTGPMIASGKELEERAFYSHFDGSLDAASRYASMKTLEKTTFEGRPVYKVALTRKDGGEDIEFYDVETGLKAGGTTQRTNPMGTVSVTSAVSEYKKFGDLMHPTVLKQSLTGVQIVTTITSVEYDKVDPMVFELPAEIKALVK